MLEPTWEHLVKESTSRRLRLSTAESCTGGLIASLITDVPGASACFLGGYVVYSNDLKTGLLGMDPGTLMSFGAISREAAEEMVYGCLRSTGADISLAVTGIAGPTGGTPEKPVGTVYLSLMKKGGEPHTEGFLLVVRDRAHFKGQVAVRALGMLMGAVLACGPAKP